MSTPLFYPQPQYLPVLLFEQAITIRELCEQAGVPCRASGAWTERKVEIREGSFAIHAEPGDWGGVRIFLPPGTQRKRARCALSVLAYALHDLVAKQSIVGAQWAGPEIPRGRQRSGQAKSNAERQKSFRARHRGA
jgi:hypothetical protein